MSAGANIGVIVILGSTLVGLWSLLRVIVGPNRRTAIGHFSYSFALFIAGAIAVASGVTSPPRLPPAEPVAVAVAPERTPVTSSTVTSSKASRASTSEKKETDPVSVAPKKPKTHSADTEPAVVSQPLSVAMRYQTSHTLVSIVLEGFRIEERDALHAIARAECAGHDFCSIGFWQDDAMTPRKLKMSDEEVAARLAHYVYSEGTNLNYLKWNCDIVIAEPQDCLHSGN